jgi:hypothetical protein
LGEFLAFRRQRPGKIPDLAPSGVQGPFVREFTKMDEVIERRGCGLTATGGIEASQRTV